MFLSNPYSKHPVLHCGVLGGQHIQGQIQAGQFNQLCGWQETGLPGDGGREEACGQTTGHYA